MSISAEALVRIRGRHFTLGQLERRLSRKRKEMADFSVPHRQIATRLDRWVQRNFKSEGAFVGLWAPLKAGGRWIGEGATRRFDPMAKILQDTGRLRISFMPFHNKETAGIGSDIPYSRPHNEGMGRLPKRRMLPEYPDVEREVTKVFQHHVDRGTTI